MTQTGGSRAGHDTAEDAALARRVAAGERDAAERLVQRYQLLIRAFLRRLTGKLDVADDLAQDTFLKLLRNADKYDPRYPMRVWLLTIARRLWINQLRRARQAPLPEGHDAPASREQDPGRVVAARESAALDRQRLDEALAQLTEQQRLTIVLFHQQNLSIAQVAGVMDLPEGTVKSHLHRARAALRRILGRAAEEPSA